MMENTRQSGERKLVITGELLGSGRAGHGAFEQGGNVYSKYIGLAESRENFHVVIPLSGVYSPKRGDGVIAKITEIIFQKWIADVNSPYEATLPLSEGVEGFVDLTKADLTKYFDYGDLIFTEIAAVSNQKHVTLTMRNRKCRKLKGGRLIRVTPAKVPRIIGKGGSMVEMIKQMTGTQIVVGQNGIVWLRGENEDLATEAIMTIEARSHMQGLTDLIKSMLEKAIGKPYVPKPVEQQQQTEYREYEKPVSRYERFRREEDQKEDTKEQPAKESESSDSDLGDVETINL